MFIMRVAPRWLLPMCANNMSNNSTTRFQFISFLFEKNCACPPHCHHKQALCLAIFPGFRLRGKPYTLFFFGLHSPASALGVCRIQCFFLAAFPGIRLRGTPYDISWLYFSASALGVSHMMLSGCIPRHPP